jgi:hypothetical protein
MNSLFKPNTVLLAARLNKWQQRYQQKLKEFIVRKAEHRERIRKINSPVPEAKWFYKTWWKDAVRAEKVKDIIRETRRAQIAAENEKNL